MSMKKLTELLRQHRRRKNAKPLPKSAQDTVYLFNAISSLPNEVLIPILRNIYPPGSFLKYNRYTNRGTVAFWDTILKANRLLVSISQISERFREISAVILKEIANATKAFSKGCDNWKTINGVHQMYREESKWQWGYGVVCG